MLGGEGFRAAATFVGTKWHVTTTKVITTNPTTKEQKEKDAFVVSQYLGKGSDSKASTAGPKKSGKATLEDSDPDLFAELLSLAEEADDHDSFMEQALSLEAVEGNKMALNAVMSTKAGSVWAARGGDN